MTTIEEYIEAKHGSGGPDGGRFEDDEDHEVHTSQVAACQRRHYWDRRRGTETEASVYFELGRVFEMMYGAALAWERGDLDHADLTTHKPWELPDLAPEVQQDVSIHVDFGGAEIPGEADWAVYRDGAVPLVEEHGPVRLVEVDPDGSRTFVWQDGHETHDETPFAEMIETKTKKDLGMLDGPQEKHFWQAYGYMYALDCPGKITYMQRNDWEMEDFPLERDEAHDMDLEARVRRKVKNLQEDDGPPTADPSSKWECYYCEHRSSCGDSLW